jgi:hypothetical protein
VSQRFNAGEFERQLRAAQRQAERDLKRSVDKANRS